MVDQNEVQILWTEKDKQIRMFYQKQGAPQKLLLEILKSSKTLDL